MAANVNEHYNILTFFRTQPLGEAKLLFALIQGELDERTVAAASTTAATKTPRRGRPAGSRNKKEKAPAQPQIVAEPAVAAV